MTVHPGNPVAPVPGDALGLDFISLLSGVREVGRTGGLDSAGAVGGGAKFVAPPGGLVASPLIACPRSWSPGSAWWTPA